MWAPKILYKNICQSLHQIFEAFNEKGSFLTHAITLELCSESPCLGKKAERVGTVLNTVTRCGRGKTLQKVLHQ